MQPETLIEENPHNGTRDAVDPELQLELNKEITEFFDCFFVSWCLGGYN